MDKTIPMASPPGEGSGLRRELGLFDATMINAGTMIASAIFIVPSAIAAGLGATGPSLLVWVIGGLVSMAGALCVAELGAAMPEAGGQYVYLQRAYGPAVGFLYGWGAFLVINTASIAAIAVGFATYVGFFTPLGDLGVTLVAVASIVLLTVINCFGLRVGATTQNILTSLKIGALVAIVVLGFGLSGGSAANFTPAWPPGGTAALTAGLGPALVAVLWAYDGWIESSYVGGEVRDPGRVLPLSIVLSVVLVAVLYVVVVAAYTWLLPAERLAASPLVASDAMTVVVGSAGAGFVAAAILVSTLGANNGIVFTSVRIPYAMAEEGLFFRWAARLNPRTRSPVLTLLVQGGVAIALTLTGSYVQLATYVVFVSFLFYALSAAAVIVLRRREPHMPRPYRAWGYPVTPLLFIGFALYLVLDTIVHTPRDSAIGAGLLAAGLPAYWYWRRTARRAH
ncbi:MAG TPA: amino acid permease [Gemmatimonadales bacterium]|nr:amino acid permease [Gemmatimonadales bacterium]